MEILAKGLSSGYDIEHLARVFYPDAAVRKTTSTKGPLVYARAGKRHLAAGLRTADGKCMVRRARLPAEEAAVKLALTRLLYDLLRQQTSQRPPWGLLTGVRPVNLYRKHRQNGEAAARRFFVEQCDVSEEKLALAQGIENRQRPVLAASRPNSYSLYISIPFCPTRCDYCSFVSRTIAREGHLMQPYLAALERELEATAAAARDSGLKLESIYIGGGTPTALDLPQLELLLQAVQTHFDTAAVPEYTVEAGRPDCTGYDKLALLKQYGVSRISINPQTMDDAVLQRIGRRHTARDISNCYADARKAGHTCVNMDLICGLPGDTPEGFAETLRQVAGLAPENITLHSLTMKRASNFVIERQSGHSSPSAMLDSAYPFLQSAGYVPYYLYRQKSGVENLENTGWARPGTEGMYNIYIMEETHTILACGAGASTKLVLCGGKVIKRRYNHKFPVDYMKNIEEILDRKKGVTSDYAGHLDPETSG